MTLPVWGYPGAGRGYLGGFYICIRLALKGRAFSLVVTVQIKLTPNLVPPLGFPLRFVLAPEPSWSSRVSWLPSCFQTLEVLIFL